MYTTFFLHRSILTYYIYFCHLANALIWSDLQDMSHLLKITFYLSHSLNTTGVVDLTGHLQHPMSQEGQKDHQGQQPPEPLPVHPAIIQKAKSVQVRQSWDRETEKQLLSQGLQTLKQQSLAH